MISLKNSNQAVNKKSPLSFLNRDKGLSLFDFSMAHPYFAAALACVCCLYIGQRYQIVINNGTGYEGVTGELLNLPKLPLVLLCLAALWIMACGIHKKLKRSLPLDKTESVTETAILFGGVAVFALASFVISSPAVAVVCAVLVTGVQLWVNRKEALHRRIALSAVGVIITALLFFFLYKAETAVSVSVLIALMLLPLMFLASSAVRSAVLDPQEKLWRWEDTLSVRGTAAVVLALLASMLIPTGKGCFIALALISTLFLWLRHSTLPVIKQVLTMAVALAGFWLAHYLNGKASSPAEAVVTVAFAAAVCALVISAISGGIKTKHVIGAMFLVGFALRLGYVLDINLPYNQHDVFPIYYNAKYPRHNSYIWHIFGTGTLPTKQVYDPGLSQFYHPPLYHTSAALWMRLQGRLGINSVAAYENIQYLTLFFSTAMMIAADNLFKEFKLGGGLRVALTAFIAFHPTFYILAGSINNDALNIMLLFLAVLFTVRWHKSPSVYNTVCLALAIGLAMLAKLSGAMVAIAVAYVMLVKLFNFRTGVVNNIKALWKRFALFALTCFPLGLWWPVRCKLLYGMPFGYVPKMSPTNNQYVGGYGTLERLFHINGTDIQNPYPNIGLTTAAGTKATPEESVFYDYSIGPYALKSSFFGEYFNKLNVNSLQNVLCYIMIIAAAVLILYSFAAMATCFFVSYRTDRNGNLRKNQFLEKGEEQSFRFLLYYYLVLVGSYVLFCFKCPFTCTMDFRYIVPTLLISGAITGIFLRGDYRWKKWARGIFIAVTAVFCLASALFYYISYTVPVA